MIDEKDWQQFKQDINGGLDFQIKHPIKQAVINTRELNVRNGPGVQYHIVEVLHQDDPVEIFEQSSNWYRIGSDKWVHKHYVEITFTQQEGIVEDPTGLNIRTGPGMQFPVSEVLPDGAPVIIEDKKENWLKIGKDKWAFYKLIKIVDFITGRVQLAQFLNVRKGPGTNHPIVRKLMKDALVTIVE